jgi:Holliday junction resolvasome RuvABC endonuclease subunit
MRRYRYLLAVDPSLTCSGWALFSIEDGRIRSVGKVKSDPPSLSMGERLRTLQERIEALINRLQLGESDIVVCEAATTVKDPHNALKVESVRAIFESVARSRAISVPGRINPRSVHHEVMGLSGKQLPRAEVKRAARRTVDYLYADELANLGFLQTSLTKHQDIVDAILLGRLGVMRVRSAADGNLPMETVFAHGDGPQRRGWRVRARAAAVLLVVSLLGLLGGIPQVFCEDSKVTPLPMPGGDPRGAADIVVCSQNLKLFGSYDAMSRNNPTYTRQKYSKKVDDLVSRFLAAKCDVVAVQEVIGKTQADGEAALNQLASRWRERSNRFFKVMTAPPSEGSMTNGFIVALDRATVEQALPYGRVQLPKIWSRQKPRLFSRPPYELQLSVRSRDSQLAKAISIVNFHFKSKRGGQDDPTGLEWETYRMEMSEGLRRVLEMRHKDAFASGESILLVLGDRNSNFDVASARILEGSLSLSSFGEKGPCRLSKRGVPLCVAESELPRRLFSVLTANAASTTYPGTYLYKGEYSWLDDIIMPAESLRYAWQTAFSEGVYGSGLIATPEEASDHALVYVTLNW